MGDRGNIVIKQKDAQKVYLYTHELGSHMGYILASALTRGRNKWDDDTCLAGIIFCEMVRGEEMDLTGFGICTEVGDNNHPLLVVDTQKVQIYVAEEERPDVPVSKVWSFEEFVRIRPGISCQPCWYEDLECAVTYILHRLQSGKPFGSIDISSRQHECHAWLRKAVERFTPDWYETREMLDLAVCILEEKKLVHRNEHVAPSKDTEFEYYLSLTNEGETCTSIKLNDSADDFEVVFSSSSTDSIAKDGAQKPSLPVQNTVSLDTANDSANRTQVVKSGIGFDVTNGDLPWKEGSGGK